MLSPKVPLLHFFANQLCAYECNGDTYTFGRAWGMDRISFSQHLCASVTHRRPIPSALRNINKIEYEYFFALSISHYHVSKHCIITAISKVDRIQMKTKKCSLDDLHCKCNSIRIFLTFFFFYGRAIYSSINQSSIQNTMHTRISLCRKWILICWSLFTLMLARRIFYANKKSSHS